MGSIKNLIGAALPEEVSRNLPFTAASEAERRKKTAKRTLAQQEAAAEAELEATQKAYAGLTQTGPQGAGAATTTKKTTLGV